MSSTPRHRRVAQLELAARDPQCGAVGRHIEQPDEAVHDRSVRADARAGANGTGEVDVRHPSSRSRTRSHPIDRPEVLRRADTAGKRRDRERWRERDPQDRASSGSTRPAPGARSSSVLQRWRTGRRCVFPPAATMRSLASRPCRRGSTSRVADRSASRCRERRSRRRPAWGRECAGSRSRICASVRSLDAVVLGIEEVEALVVHRLDAQVVVRVPVRSILDLLDVRPREGGAVVPPADRLQDRNGAAGERVTVREARKQYRMRVPLVVGRRAVSLLSDELLGLRGEVARCDQSGSHSSMSFSKKWVSGYM